MLLLLLAQGCGPSPTHNAQFLAGADAITLPAGTPVGHYLGPDGVVATGRLEDGAAFVLADHTLIIGRGCARVSRQAGEEVAERAATMTVIQAKGWTRGRLGDASRYHGPITRLDWDCGPVRVLNIVELPGQPSIGWNEHVLGVVRAWIPADER